MEAEIRRLNPSYAALTRPPPIAVAEVQQLLDGDDLLLEYALGEERSFLWAIDRDSFASFELPGRAAIEAAARRVYGQLSTVDPRGDAAAGDAPQALSRMLLGPVAGELAGRRLVVVADGALHYLPFAALPEPAGGAPLLAGHEVVHLPSAAALAVMRRQLAGRRPAPKWLAVVADPVFDRRDPRLATEEAAQPARGSVDRSGEPPALSFDRLPASRREAERIAALLPPGQVLQLFDFDARRQNLLRPGLGQYRILHFATHGFFDARHPELSGLVLSLVDEHGAAQDGLLRLRDVYELELGADLVVLSGCQTALGREIRGEGLVGLTRGFMYAGVPRVVASLWRVGDRATAELMERFYRGLVAGLRPAAALRAAQLEIRARPRWADPYHWAAFVLEGDWR
ncbi:MAG: CHAT domain-containing protein [Acidobacteria bacterium]|nr:MAG: CHAT domain-containing protein [Acidobacteriota bacterium]